jgi:MATE family multidrug resistance protein
MIEKQYYKQNLSLAIPIILSSLGQNLVQIVDTLMVGHLGTIELAATSFAGMLTYNALVIGMGIAMALTPLVGQNYAQKKTNIVVSLFQNSLSLNTIISIIIVALLISLMPFLQYFGQDERVIEMCKPYYVVVTFSFIPMLIFLCFKQFMEGIDNTKAAMIITISANVLNIIGNYLLIYGKFGFPRLGVLGAGVSTFVSRLLSPIAFFLYIYLSKKYSFYIKSFKWKNFSKYLHTSLLRIGLPIAGQMFLEFLALSGISLMMGWISATCLAAFQIISTMISTTFLTASGICSATTVLVSHAFGTDNEKEVKHNFYAGFRMVLVVMFFFALTFIFFGKYIAELFTEDENVINVASGFFIVAGFFQLFDGSQVSGLAGLRGINDVAKPMKYAFISYALVSLPFAYVCGFVFNLGAWSIFAGFMAGLLTAAILYHRRFYKTVKRHFNSIKHSV